VKLVADERVDRGLVLALRSIGHEIAYIAESAPGVSDQTVLSECDRIGAVLLTADKDFGELVYRRKQAHHGVILIRLGGESSTVKESLVTGFLQRHGSELGSGFAVIGSKATRIRRV